VPKTGGLVESGKTLTNQERKGAKNLNRINNLEPTLSLIRV